MCEIVLQEKLDGIKGLRQRDMADRQIEGNEANEDGRDKIMTDRATGNGEVTQRRGYTERTEPLNDDSSD